MPAIKLTLLSVVILCASGCMSTYMGVSGLIQDANRKEVVLEHGVTTPEDVIAVLGEPDASGRGPYPDCAGGISLIYKTVYASYSIRVTYLIEDGCSITYDYDRWGEANGQVYFYFDKNGNACFSRSIVPIYQRGVTNDSCDRTH